MQTQVVLRKITSASAYLAELLDTSSADAHTGSDRGAIALGAHEFEKDAVKAVVIRVEKDRRRRSYVQHDDVDVSGIENVTEGSASPRFQGQTLQARLSRNFVKSSIPIIAVQQHRFAEARADFYVVYLRIYVAVGYKKVQPSVVIHVKKTRTPADVRIVWLPNSGSPAHIIESFGAQVAVQRIGLLFKVGNKKAQVPAMVVIAKIHSHIPQFHAFTAQRDPGQQAHVGERAVVIVVIKIVGHRIVGHEQVLPSVIVIIDPHHP